MDYRNGNVVPQREFKKNNNKMESYAWPCDNLVTCPGCNPDGSKRQSLASAGCDGGELTLNLKLRSCLILKMTRTKESSTVYFFRYTHQLLLTLRCRAFD